MIAEASSFAIKACFMQNTTITDLYSKKLTQTQINYNCIEKEMCEMLKKEKQTQNIKKHLTNNTKRHKRRCLLLEEFEYKIKENVY